MAQLSRIALGCAALLTVCAIQATLPVEAMQLTGRIGPDVGSSTALAPAASSEESHAHEATTVLPLLDDNAAFALRILLTKGHLRVGIEDYISGSVDHALAHLGQPVSVLHRDIVKWIGRPGADPTETPLTALVAAVRTGKPVDVVSQRLSMALQGLDGTMEILDARIRESPAFIMVVVMALLRAAVDDYEIGVSEGQVVDVIEYQDARGFALEARAYIEARSTNLKASGGGAYGILMAESDALIMELPPVTQSDHTLTTAADLRRAVVRIGLLYDSFK